MRTAKRPLLRRLLIYDSELRYGSFPTVERLARLTESVPKTVRRDLAYLRHDFGAPVAYHRECNGWHYTEPTYRFSAVMVTEGELPALFLDSQALQQYAGTPFEHNLRRAISKLGQLLPDEISLQGSDIQQTHSFRQSVTSLHDIDIFRRLAEAVLQRKQLHLTYWTASRDALTEWIVDPWHLSCIEGEWFMVGWCHLRQAPRMFAPTRIRSLDLTGQTITIPDDFRINDFLEGSFRVIRDHNLPLQTVRLRFEPSAAKYIREKIWHPSQVLHSESDGSVTLELTLRSFIEVRRWVLSWGSACEVLEPLSLRADISREAALIAARVPVAANPVFSMSSSSRRSRKHYRAG